MAYPYDTMPPVGAPPAGGDPNNTYGTAYSPSNQYSYGSSRVGGYTNLPGGIYNAGNSGRDNAYVRDVQGDELVAQQMAGLLAHDSPYLQQARLGAIQGANARGALNSSIAGGAAEAAAIQAAMPIAQSDAEAYRNAAAQNQQYLNQILAERMGNETAIGTANIGANASRYATDMSLQRQRENLAYSGEQQGLDRAFADYLARMGYSNQAQRDAFNLAGNLFGQQQGFNYNASLQGMENPFILQNPEAFGGFMDWANQGMGGVLESLLGYSQGGAGYSPYGFNPYGIGGGYGNGMGSP
jgi:hypothetical protein